MSHRSWICRGISFRNYSRLSKYAEIISSETSALSAFTVLTILFVKLFGFMKKQTHSTPGILYLNLIWIIFSLSKYAFTRHLIEHQSSGTFQFVKVSIVRSSFYLKSTDRYIWPPALHSCLTLFILLERVFFGIVNSFDTLDSDILFDLIIARHLSNFVILAFLGNCEPY